MPDPFDIAIIGGGINGCGLARDATGRGLRVFLCDAGDIGGATSSASTKLIHGGLRYLEQYNFPLVRESLAERERLWAIAPHVIRPLRLVLPWRKGLRPRLILRAGLFVYDHLGGRKRLPPTRSLDLRRDALGAPLKAGLGRAWEFSDCAVFDNRLAILNARDAERLGAEIKPRLAAISAKRQAGLWRVTFSDGSTITARAIVNATGPWADRVEKALTGRELKGKLRLVQGAHIVVRKLYDHDRAYFFQNPDGRVLFAIPFEGDFTLLGTTERDVEAPSEDAWASWEEIDYLCKAASEWFARPVVRGDIVWTYAGIRPLIDDGRGKAQNASRDFSLVLDGEKGAPPFLSIHGGKLTTYRRVAEAVLERLAGWFPNIREKRDWTGTAPLPGGFSIGETAVVRGRVQRDYPFLEARESEHFFRHYGLDAWQVLGAAKSRADLGRDFGGGLTEAEVGWLRRTEWARRADDIVWRRTKRGLRMTPGEIAALGEWLAQQAGRE